MTDGQLPPPRPPQAVDVSPPHADSKPSFFKRRYLKVPVWGWTAIVGVLAIGAIGSRLDDDEDDAVEGIDATTTTSAPESTATAAPTMSATTSLPDVEQTSTTATVSTLPEATTTEASTTTTTTTTVVPTTTTTTTTTITTAPPPPTDRPLPGFGGGTHLVGPDIDPGRYLATGSGCYWERLSGLSGDFDDIITNAFGDGQQVVEILDSDEAFSSQGCGRWELYQPPAEPTPTFGDGDWVVGEQIVPGRYRADSQGCYWERSSGFTHDFAEIITNNYSDGSSIVEIHANDARFTTSGCGTWEPG